MRLCLRILLLGIKARLDLLEVEWNIIIIALTDLISNVNLSVI